MIDYRTQMLTDVLASLESAKRREGRLFGAYKKHGNIPDATKTLARYNNLENQIAFMANEFNLERRWAPHKLKLEEI